MKLPVVSTIALAFCAVAATAQAEVKIATVNMQQLYQSFHKRVDAEKRLNEQKTVIQEQVTVRQEKLKVLVEEATKLKNQLDPSLSQANAQKIREELQIKSNELQALQQDYKTFAERRQIAFQEMQKRELILLLQEIQEVVDTTAAEAGFDLVLDAGAVTPVIGTKVFPYVKKSYDITPDMIKKINKDAPAGFDPAAQLQQTGAAQ